MDRFKASVRAWAPQALALLFVMGLMAVRAIAFAQGEPAPAPTAVPVGPGASQADFIALLRSIEYLCLPLLTSLLLQGVKMFISFIPDWALPFIAPLLAVLVNALSQGIAGINLTPAPDGIASLGTAAVAGGGGAVWLNQLVKQAGKPSNEPQQADRKS